MQGTRGKPLVPILLNLIDIDNVIESRPTKETIRHEFNNLSFTTQNL